MRVTEPLVFSVAGTPRPKSRPRKVRGRWVSTANPHEKLWKKAVEQAAFAAVIWRGDPMPIFNEAVRVRMVFTFRPPDSKKDRLGKPHDIILDLDNCAKLIADVMVRAKVLRDDSLIAAWPTEKWWGLQPGVAVLVETMNSSTIAPAEAASVAPDWLASSSTGDPDAT